MAQKQLQTLSPVDESVYVRRNLHTHAEATLAIARARDAQRQWQALSLSERAAVCTAAVDYFDQHRDTIATEISWQMGRPIAFSGGEINGLRERAMCMIELAADALADYVPTPQSGFRRWITRRPLGLVLTVAPWNYPLLTTVNSVVPALMAGNAVLIKPSAQTPLCGEHFSKAFAAAGAPDGLVQTLFLEHDDCAALLHDGAVDFCCFTGSVGAGKAIEKAAAGSFIGLALELGGKDPAYVMADADFDYSVENLVDGAFFNSGQSCCGIERIYVERSLYRDFVDAYVAKVENYRLGSPLDPDTSLGPLVRRSAAAWVSSQIDAATRAGATACVDTQRFNEGLINPCYLAPQVLTGVDHSMSLMREESFGPVVGIMPVDTDREALQLMNDSDLGLTASLWTRDAQRAENLADDLQCGTVFMNRCDYLDPSLAWTGVKNTGRGVSLSRFGYDQLTRVQSRHFKLESSQ